MIIRWSVKVIYCYGDLVPRHGELFEGKEEEGGRLYIIIIITRPKPPFGRQGLAGSWGQDTDEVSTFLVFLMSHFAPAALSSDLTNLGPLMTMKIHLETLKTIETNQKP